MTTLTEMLVQQTKEYIRMATDEGFSQSTSAIQQMLANIQSAILLKKREHSQAGPGDTRVISIRGEKSGHDNQKIS
jgi:hypothetical protein